MPSRCSPWASTRAVTSLNARRLARVPASGGLEHRAVLVERREVRRQLVQVRAQPVRARPLDRLGDGRAEAEHPQRQRPLLRLGEHRHRRPHVGALDARPAGRSSRSGRGRTAGTAPCCRRTTASGPSRTRSRGCGRSTGRRTSARRCRPGGRRRRAARAGRSGFFSATAARPRSIASSMTSMNRTGSPLRLLQPLAVVAEHEAERRRARRAPAAPATRPSPTRRTPSRSAAPAGADDVQQPRRRRPARPGRARTPGRSWRT